MNGEDDIRREVRLIFDNLMGPGALYRHERHFWLELWRAPVVEAIEDDGLETRMYGRVQVNVIAALPRTPLFNVVLGAADPGAVEHGHLAEAREWLESLAIDFRVPVRPGFEETGAAEDLLNQRGYRRTANLARFVRDASPLGFPEPPGIEVDEWDGEDMEGFGEYFEEPYGIEWPATAFFDCLLGKRPWRCYVAIDENDNGVGAATMMGHYEISQLGFAATEKSVRGRDVHLALIRRRILDATGAGCRMLFADTEESVDHPGGMSTGARNLLRAGFKHVSSRAVWGPPLADGLEPDDEDEDEPDEDDGPEGDHDFELKY